MSKFRTQHPYLEQINHKPNKRYHNPSDNQLSGSGFSDPYCDLTDSDSTHLPAIVNKKNFKHHTADKKFS
jgi:hypothetical protein